MRNFSVLRHCRLIVAGAMALLPLGCLASGQDYSQPVSVSTSRIQPEYAAIDGFLHGHLGILWPSYDRAFLMMAYRQASGLPAASAEDEKQWLALAAKDGVKQPTQDWAPNEWDRARKKLGLPALPDNLGDGARELGEHRYGDNCQQSAFNLAAQTLTLRLQQHPDELPLIKLWATTQDSVFSRCEPKDPPLAMPALPANAPQWLIKDRAYQEAAYLFYEEKQDEASTAFEAIASDKDSVWHEWADYLVVRIWRRAHSYSFNTLQDWASDDMYARLNKIQQTARDSAVKAAALGLRVAVSTEIAPKDAYAEHWHRIDAKEPVFSIDDWLADENWYWRLLKEEDFSNDWLYATRAAMTDSDYPSVDEQRIKNVIALWKANHTQLWLASAMMVATEKMEEIDEMVKESKVAKPSDPLYIHLAWHRIRLLVMTHRFAAARTELDAALPYVKNEALGTRQAFDQFSMLLAPSLEELGHHIVHTVVGQDVYHAPILDASMPLSQRANFVDLDTQNWLASQLTDGEFLQLSNNQQFAPVVRKQFAWSAWHGAIFLSEPQIEHDATQNWAENAGEKAIVDAIKGGDMEQARFLMARWLLLDYMKRIHDAGGSLRDYVADGRLNHWDTVPLFHTATEQIQQKKNHELLAKSDDLQWMGEQLLPWIRKHPQLNEGPAILEKIIEVSHFAVRNTSVSKQAFSLLHKQYAHTKEAERTRYYY